MTRAIHKNGHEYREWEIASSRYLTASMTRTEMHAYLMASAGARSASERLRRCDAQGTSEVGGKRDATRWDTDPVVTVNTSVLPLPLSTIMTGDEPSGFVVKFDVDVKHLPQVERFVDPEDEEPPERFVEAEDLPKPKPRRPVTEVKPRKVRR